MTLNKKHRGTTLDEWLAEEGILDEVTTVAMKSALSWQLALEMKKRKITKLKMAAAMKTSRTQVNRILDPKAGNVTLETLQRTAKIVGRELRVELV